jgi:hypothetical protein
LDQASVWAFVGSERSELAPEIDLGGIIPRAWFRKLVVPPKSTYTFRAIMAVGGSVADASALANGAATSTAAFENSWAESHSKWEARWQSAFDPTDQFFSGCVPTLELDGMEAENTSAAGVSRVYYASVLSIVSQLRTNLPLMYDKVWPTSQGSSEALRKGGVVIGGAISYFWDEALSSLLLALLEPHGRPPTFNAWFTADLKGKKHNWFDLDCGPDNPIGSVYGPCNFTGVAPPVKSGNNVYPYNIWSYGLNLFNYLSTSSDSRKFLESRAG